MRLLIVNLLATALVLFSAGFASAYQLRLVPLSGAGGLIGDTFGFEVYLDTQTQSGIYSSVVGIVFDESVLSYRADLSASDAYYPLYTPSGMSFVSLIPLGCVGLECSGVGIAPEIFVGQSNLLNIGWTSNSWPTAGGETIASGTNVYLSTVFFEAIGAGNSGIDFGFVAASNSFVISDGLGGLTDITASVATQGSTSINIVPEPTTALLIGLGLMGLGVAGRNRA
jgi:hypothetical protein